MCQVRNISHRQYLSYVVNSLYEKGTLLMIEIQVDQLLAGHGRTFYWLAKKTGISHTTFWRVEKRKGPRGKFYNPEKNFGALASPTRGVVNAGDYQKKKKNPNRPRPHNT